MTPLKLFASLLFVAVLAAGCGSAGEQEASVERSGGESPSGGERVEIGGAEAIVRGEGGYGVVLSHGAAYDAASWDDQAGEIAENGFVTLSVEDTSTESVTAAAEYLADERGVEGVALVGASAGTSGVFGAAEENPDITDQIIVLSGSGDVSGLGEVPKLFVASEGEGLADTAREMAEEAPGSENEALILPGSAHAQAIFDTGQGGRLLETMIERLEERR